MTRHKTRGKSVELRPAWRRNDPKIEADAVAFWTRLHLLPDGVDPAQRAKELLAVAYRGGKLVAVTSATIEYIPFLRARMAILRGATDPEHRRGHTQMALAEPSREALREWALAHPEERLGGAVAFVEPGEWGDFARIPLWPEAELMVVGYSQEGKQVRAAWFKHFLLDL